MALFRAITAEEEAATALILAVKQRGYPGADSLNPRNHLHKASIWPFVRAVNNFLADLELLPPVTLELAKEGPPTIGLRFEIVLEGEPLHGRPDHPLNFVLRAGPGGDQRVHMFEAALEGLASGSSHASLVAYLRGEANLRNRILYANDQRVPDVEIGDQAITGRLRRVNTLNMLTIMVLQTDQLQLFVVQCLEALLRALTVMEGEGFDYDLAWQLSTSDTRGPRWG